MLSQAQRTTILELHTKGVGKREIARVLGISRPTVRKVLRSKATEVPELRRPEKAEPYRYRILEFSATARGISCESMRNWWPAGLRFHIRH
jgi:IS30 family transposase